MTRLTSTFGEVKKTFFPRWDKANEWKVRRKSRLSCGYTVDAMCNRETKTIEIMQSYVPEDDEELRCLFAHEICHAVVPGNHRGKWQKRLLKVADRATELGQKKLSRKIHRQIQIAQTARKVTLLSVHHNIQDALGQRPNASFEEVIAWVADEWALTTDGLLKKYKNLETFFDKTQRDALAYRELVAKYNQPRVDGEPPKDSLS